MLPSTVLDGMAPRIMVNVQSVPIPLLLDSGAEVSVLPLELNKIFNPPVHVPSSGREVRAFGNAVVSLLGPVPVSLTLCGIQVTHPFYFIDAPAPPIAGYDLMRAARLVVDVDNRLVWSRLTQPRSADPVGPNPSVPVTNSSVHSQVSFVQACSEDPVPPSSASASETVLVEPSPVRSSVVSRQVSAIVSSPGCRASPVRSVLDPRVPPFRPRVDPSVVLDAPHPHMGPTQPPRSVVCPLVDPDDTPLKTPLFDGSVYSASSVSDLAVPPHLQELFDQTVNGTRLSLSHQQSLAAVMRRNSDAFATGPMDLGFCAVLQHDIDVGDSQPIKQPPRRPPMAARDAEDDILDEMLQTGVIKPSTSPWSSPFAW